MELDQIAAEQRKLQSDIDAKTAKLLDKRRRELEELSKPLEERITNLEKNAIVAETRLSVAMGKEDALRVSIAELEKTNNDLQEELKTAHSDLDANKHAIELSVSQEKALREAISRANSELDSINSELSIKDTLLAGIKNDIEYLTGKIASQKQDFESKTTDKQGTLDRLDARLLSVKQDIALEQKSIAREREEIAQRKRALDDREEVLKRREQKAQIQESAIQQNASLLDL